MGAVEHTCYSLTCPQCQAVGTARWWETNGAVHLRKPVRGLDVSDNFERVPDPNAPGLVWGRALVCRVWTEVEPVEA